MSERVCIVWLLLAVLGCEPTGMAGGTFGGGPAFDGGAALPNGPPPPIARQLDLLFVVDNSASMNEAQDKLRAAFPALIETLAQSPGGLPELHVAVVSTDVGAGSRPLANGGCVPPGGDRGIFQTKPTCGLEPGTRFLSSADQGTRNNFTGTIDSAFSCLANLGSAGCGYEHPLQATRLALEEAVTPENRGFLHQDGVLAVVILSDEDDCSAAPDSDLFTDDASFPMTTASFRCAQVGHLCDGVAPPLAPFDVPLESCQARPAGRLIAIRDAVASLRAHKRQPDRQILVAGIFGWPLAPGARYRYVQTNQGVDIGPICQSPISGEATVGLRLEAFVDSFGPSGSFTSICEDDYRPLLRQLARSALARF